MNETEQTSAESQNPTPKSTSPARRKVNPIIFGAIVLLGIICCILLILFPSGIRTSDLALGAELDRNGHVLENNGPFATDVPEIYLGFNFFSLSNSAVSLQACWFY